MIRSTTPTHRMIFPEGILDDIVRVYVMYKQGDIVRNILWADADSKIITVDRDNNQVLVSWSQEDTAKFRDDREIQIQVKLINEDSEAIGTDVYYTCMHKILDNRILGGGDGTGGWGGGTIVGGGSITGGIGGSGDETTEGDQNDFGQLDQEDTTPGWTWVYDDLTAAETDQLYSSTGIEAEFPDTWDVDLSPAEAQSLARKLGLPYSINWDMRLSSSESGRICRKLGIQNR